MYQLLVEYPGKLSRKARDLKIEKLARRKPTSSGYSPVTRNRQVRFDFRRLGPAVNAYELLARRVRLTNLELSKTV